MFTLDAFIAFRPFLYHRTHAANLPAVREDRELRCAEDLRGGPPGADRPRRAVERVVRGGRTLLITDQKPLAVGAIEWEEGWDVGRWLALLDRLVFFWPGDGRGPKGYAKAHGAKYDREADAGGGDRPVLIRAPLADVLAANPALTPLFCRYNSGGPRAQPSGGSPRGGSTFRPAGAVDFTPGKVQEVAFDRGPVRLPGSTRVRAGGEWEPLRASPAGDEPPGPPS